MFNSCSNDVVSLVGIGVGHPFEHHVVRFGAPTGEDDLLWPAAQKAGDLRSRLFIKSVFDVAESFGVVSKERVLDAYEAAYSAQRTFERQVTRIGEEALRFAEEHSLPVIVVLEFK